MSTILILIPRWHPQVWHQAFVKRSINHEIRLWPDQAGDLNDIEYVCAWHPPPGVLRMLPRLKAIFSMGAGVEHLLADETLPNVPILRMTDPELTCRMTEYVTMNVLSYHRRRSLYDFQQRNRIWKPESEHRTSDVTVGMMGLGVLGLHSADMLRQFNFNVVGWSLTPKQLSFQTYHGTDGLPRFLAGTDILVCLLPLTSATRGILNLSVFRQLSRNGPLGGAYLINAGRGKLQIEADVVQALSEGSLDGAAMDVFEQEPLPSSSPLWAHPKVTITPHVAAGLPTEALVDIVLSKIEQIETTGIVSDEVDRKRGY
jgi:glyoxylate/hydroxypyruvate reductase A